VTPELYGRLLSRVFTVHGLSPSVDVNEAPLEVLRVLPGVTAEAAEALVSFRRETPFRSPGEVAAFLAVRGFPAAAVSNLSTSHLSRVYTITSVGRSGGTIARGVACRVEVGAPGAGSVKILRWIDYVATGEGV
jgi:type II secretory pathway component PulK